MDLVKKIIKEKKDCVIISPHFDDAVLSCGGLLEQLAGKTNITIANVFTAAHDKPYTLSAKQFLKASGNITALDLYKEREKEDKAVLSQFPVKVINLGLQEALFRRRKQQSFLGKFLPEFDHVYPTYRWHIVKRIAKDDYAVSELKKKLKIFKNKKRLIFAPYGIGEHVDHAIVRKVCEDLFDTVLFYSDFPYNRRLDTYGNPINNGKVYRLDPDIRKKTKLIKTYKTQFSGLFPNGKVTNHEEVYFSDKGL